jgi:hypothetical protein
MIHSNIQDFMAGLKALPKEGPARGQFITAHVNHPPFVQALGQHPQGTQIKNMLNAHLNSPKNAGVTPGQTKMMAKSEAPNLPLWKENRILDEAHIPDLEQRAAIHEFTHKTPKEEAEKKAHQEYQREQQLKAAAKHYAGFKAAKAAGEKEDAAKHHTMYSLHLQKLGFEPHGPVPREIENHLTNAKSEPHYSFSAHKADSFLFNY